MVGKAAAALTVIALLLAPSILTAFAWTGVNFVVAFIATAIFVLASLFAPRIRWWVFPIVLIATAIPPYPHWIWHTEQGWTFRMGAQLRDLPGVGRGILIMVGVCALLLFALQFLLMRMRATAANRS